MNYDNFNKKIYQVKLGKMIHHLELYQHKHHHDLPDDMSLNNIKKTIRSIDVKSPHKKDAIKDVENNDIDNLIKNLKKLKNDIGFL